MCLILVLTLPFACCLIEMCSGACSKIKGFCCNAISAHSSVASQLRTNNQKKFRHLEQCCKAGERVCMMNASVLYYFLRDPLSTLETSEDGQPSRCV